MTIETQCVPASRFSLDILADLYTQTFADYFYPAIITPTQLAEFIRVEQLDLDYSPVLLVGDRRVALATVGLRGTQALCRGFGVIVPFRGQGMAGRLAQAMMNQARRAGAREMSLGVLKQNTHAVQTYRRAGFRVTRDTYTLEWQRDGDSGASGTWPAGVYQTEQSYLLDHFHALHSAQPAWLRDLPSLRELELSGLALGRGEAPTAYILKRDTAEGEAELLDLAGRTADDIYPLLLALQQRYRRLTVGGEPEDSPALAALSRAGFTVTHERYAMVADL